MRHLGRADTLDRWAGERLTRDDAATLRTRLGAHGLARLLRPVTAGDAVALPRPGAGPWDPEAVLLGLGGGLAEWCTDGGTLRPCGPSAVRAARDPDEPAGLRVVVVTGR